MKETEAAAIALNAIAVKKTVFSSTLFGSMIVFQDPAYIIIAIVGAFISMGSAQYDYLKLKKSVETEGKVCHTNMYMELSRAFVIGLLFTILSFMVLLHSGEKIVNHYAGDGFVKEIFPSIWMVLTMIMATGAVSIYTKIQNRLRGIK